MLTFYKIERDPNDKQVYQGAIMLKTLLILLASILMISCAASIPRPISDRKIPIYNSAHPIPATVNAEFMEKVSVVHGHGCGGFGEVGSLEGVHALLRNLAITRQADAVLVTQYQEPYYEQRGNLLCHVNNYTAYAELLRIPVFSYTPPVVPDNKPANQKLSYVMPAGFDKTWSALINAVSSDFFELQNYEKESGLLTLSYDPDSPADYVDCGHWTRKTTDHSNDFAGPYVLWLKQSEQAGKKNGQGRFDMGMKINLRVQALTDTSTQVELNALYKVSAAATNMDFKFKSGTVSTVEAPTSPNGIATTRMCQSTYKLEDHLLDTIKKITFNKV